MNAKSTNPPADDNPKAPADGAKAPTPNEGATSIAPPDSSDPGPFNHIEAHASGSHLHINIPHLAWGNPFDLKNSAYAHALAKAIRDVTNDFFARRTASNEVANPSASHPKE